MARSHWAENFFVLVLQYPKGRLSMKTMKNSDPEFHDYLYNISRKSPPSTALFLTGCLKSNKTFTVADIEAFRNLDFKQARVLTFLPNKPVPSLGIGIAVPIECLSMGQSHEKSRAENHSSQERLKGSFGKACDLSGKEAQRADGSLRNQSVDRRHSRLSERLFRYPRHFPLSPGNEPRNDHPAEPGDRTP